MPAYTTSPLPDTNGPPDLVQVKTHALLKLTLAQAVPLYEVEKLGGLKAGDHRGIEFATATLATGAQFIRDMIVDAGIASATASMLGRSPIARL